MDTELKKNISKIKKLLKQRDYDVIDIGIELIISLNDPEIFETLLDGIKFEIPIDKKSGWQAKHEWPMELIRNNFFTGTAPARPYLDYALWNIIGYAPQKSRIDKSIKLSNIKKVELEGGIKDPKWEKLPAGFLNFNNLTSLKVSGGCNSKWVGYNKTLTNWSGVKSLDGISELTSLTHLYISGHDTDNLDFLSSHTNLLYLKANNCSYLRNIDGVKNCKSLTELNLESCHSLVNLDGLINCKNLTKLSLKSCHSLVNIDGLINCAKLMDNHRHREMSTSYTWEVDFPCFNLEDCSSLVNIDGLINAKQLTGINIRWCPSLENIDGLVNCINISNIQFGKNDIIKNLDSLANKKKIKRLDVGVMIGLEDIKGITSCSNLTHFRINSSKLTNIKQLANCKKLEFLDVGICQDITFILDLKKLKNLRLDIYNTKRDIPPSYKFSTLEAHDIICYKKRIALVMALNKNDTKALSKFKDDTGIDLSFCNGLKSVNGLANFGKLTDLDLSNCKNIKPKPSPVHMSTRAQVIKYQEKLLKKAGKRSSEKI